MGRPTGGIAGTDAPFSWKAHKPPVHLGPGSFFCPEAAVAFQEREAGIPLEAVSARAEACGPPRCAGPRVCARQS